MKKWSNPEIEELNIVATAQTPTTIDSADDYADGYYRQGEGSGSGTSTTIPYYPNN